ncbi:MAG: ATP-binding protein, partial [Candidatus Aenigmarchaeota archaeon]|nr:ATP-binding protein [Candidatus Aenigmarchaeota archaeon]
EFRKWGIGLLLASQVLSDFRGAIRANIGTEIQLRTKYTGDIRRVKMKYGTNYSRTIPKLTVGTGLVQNAEYNEGKPYFINFRPLMHDTHRLSDEELTEHQRLNKEVWAIQDKLKELKEKKVDVKDMETELGMVMDKKKEGKLKMASTYLESVKSKLAGK